MTRQTLYGTSNRTDIPRAAARWFLCTLAVALACTAACTPIPYLPSETTSDQQAAASAPSNEPPVPAIEPSTAEPAVETPTTESTLPVRQLQQPKSRVLVLRSGDAENYRAVADSLSKQLEDRYVLHQLNLAEPGIREAAIVTGSSGWSAAIAIGEDAAEFAAAEFDIDTVFCQIFDYQPLLAANQNLYGVEPLPPLKLQLESWKQIAPNATAVGLIVSQNEADFADEAKRVAADLGIELRVALAVTDQDAIYQFKRFAQAVDAYPEGSGVFLVDFRICTICQGKDAFNSCHQGLCICR